MQHHWHMAAAILTDISGAKPLRHVEIELQGAALPIPAQRVAQYEFELRPVEGALAGVDGVAEPGRFDRRLEVVLGAVPNLVAAGPMRRPVGEFDRHIRETEIAVDRQQQFAERDRLKGDLASGTENMRVVLGEGAHPHDAVQRTRRLVAVAAAEFGEPQRQFAIAPQPVAEDQDMAGTVHRLQRENFLVPALGNEHVLAEILPVPGRLPQRAVEQLRPLDLLVTGRIEPPAHIVLDDPKQLPALGMPEDAADRLFLQVEQVELAAEAAMALSRSHTSRLIGSSRRTMSRMRSSMRSRSSGVNGVARAKS